MKLIDLLLEKLEKRGVEFDEKEKEILTFAVEDIEKDFEEAEKIESGESREEASGETDQEWADEMLENEEEIGADDQVKDTNAKKKINNDEWSLDNEYNQALLSAETEEELTDLADRVPHSNFDDNLPAAYQKRHELIKRHKLHDQVRDFGPVTKKELKEYNDNNANNKIETGIGDYIPEKRKPNPYDNPGYYTDSAGRSRKGKDFNASKDVGPKPFPKLVTEDEENPDYEEEYGDAEKYNTLYELKNQGLDEDELGEEPGEIDDENAKKTLNPTTEEKSRQKEIANKIRNTINNRNKDKNANETIKTPTPEEMKQVHDNATKWLDEQWNQTKEKSLKKSEGVHPKHVEGIYKTLVGYGVPTMEMRGFKVQPHKDYEGDYFVSAPGFHNWSIHPKNKGTDFEPDYDYEIYDNFPSEYYKEEE